MMSRDRQELWQVVVFAAVSVLAIALAATHACGCASRPPTIEDLPAEDIAHVKAHDATLKRCMAEGREAGSYAAYDACKKDAGISR